MFPELLVVNVTQDHIDAGTPEDCHRCPIALATLDAIQAGPTITVEVQEDTIDLTNGFYRQRYFMPAEARSFIADFDSIDTSIHCEPFTFEAEGVAP